MSGIGFIPQRDVNTQTEREMDAREYWNEAKEIILTKK